MSRVYGPDLMLEVCRRSVDKEWSHFFYGAAAGVADELASNLAELHPGLEVAGTHSPPFRSLSDDEIEETVEFINASEADIVWVGLSSPKQERWMHRLRPHLKAPVILGVGAAFDIHAGQVPQAPRWMHRSGLEWVFRLSVEPRRLWRRYLTSVPRFAWRLARQKPRLLDADD